jgi:hypothetical protein
MMMMIITGHEMITEHVMTVVTQPPKLSRPRTSNQLAAGPAYNVMSVPILSQACTPHATITRPPCHAGQPSEVCTYHQLL